MKYFYPKSWDSRVALIGSENFVPLRLTGLVVPLVTTLSPEMEISQRMVRVSPGMRLSWGWRSSE